MSFILSAHSNRMVIGGVFLLSVGGVVVLLCYHLTVPILSSLGIASSMRVECVFALSMVCFCAATVLLFYWQWRKKSVSAAPPRGRHCLPLLPLPSDAHTTSLPAHPHDYQHLLQHDLDTFIVQLRTRIVSFSAYSESKQQKIVDKQQQLLVTLLKACQLHHRLDVWKSVVQLLVVHVKRSPLLCLLSESAIFIVAAKAGLPYFDALFQAAYPFLQTCLAMEQDVLCETDSAMDSLLPSLMQMCIRARREAYWETILQKLQTIHPRDSHILYHAYKPDLFYNLLNVDAVFSFAASFPLRQDYYYTLIRIFDQYLNTAMLHHHISQIDVANLLVRAKPKRCNTMLFDLLNSHCHGHWVVKGWLRQSCAVLRKNNKKNTYLYADISHCIAAYVLGTQTAQVRAWSQALSVLSARLGECDFKGLLLPLSGHQSVSLHAYASQVVAQPFVNALWKVTFMRQSFRLLRTLFLYHKALFFLFYQWCQSTKNTAYWLDGVRALLCFEKGRGMLELLMQVNTSVECEQQYCIPLFSRSTEGGFIISPTLLEQFLVLLSSVKCALPMTKRGKEKTVFYRSVSASFLQQETDVSDGKSYLQLITRYREQLQQQIQAPSPKRSVL